MKSETFFDNFEVLAEAPNGLQELRELILELAVRGKLVTQDENDEPAFMLLEKIRIEKEILIKKNKIQKSDPKTPIDVEDFPFALPKGWEWGRLGDICLLITDGSHNSPPSVSIGYPYITVKDIVNDHIDFDICKFVTKESYEKLRHNGCKPELWDVLFSKDGTVGKVTVIDFEKEFVVLSSLAILRPKIDALYPFFLKYLLKARPILNQALEFKSGSALKRIILAKIKLLKIPLPPLEEQHRIVAKVDQLMSLCDELEARQQKKREHSACLNSAALNRLLAARAPEEFAEGWRCISDNFDLLYDAPENVSALRQAILQLAVKGLLVPQDEKDETAKELLKRIRTKKVNTSPTKQKKERPSTSIQPEGIPYNAPIGWEWVKLSEISERIHYGFTASADYSSTAVKLLRITDIQDNQVNWNTVPGCQIDGKEVPKYELHQNDILIARTGGTIGKTFLVDKIPQKAVFASYLIRVIPSPELLARYLKLFLESPFYWDQIRANSSGTGQPNVNGVALSNIIVPLPPISEQRRIVARVDQLMSLCDELEAGLLRSQADSERLMEAVVGRVPAG